MNKTIALTALALIGTAFLLSPIRIFAAGLTKTDLDNQYSHWVSLFDSSSGITSTSVLNSTTTNDADGLTLNLSLSMNQTTGQTAKQLWSNVASNAGVDTFVAELCSNSNATQCWLSLVPFDEKYESGAISEEDSDSNYTTTQTVNVAAFSSKAGIKENIPSANTTVTIGGQMYSYVPTTHTATSIQTLTLSKGASYTVSLWYCAGGDGATAYDTYTSSKVAFSSPTTFGSNLCGGSSYFQIGSSVPVTIPADATTLQQQTKTSQQALQQSTNASSTDDDNLPKCGVVPGLQNGTINGCIAQGAYFIYWLTNWVAALFGKLFDFFIGYSVSDASYRYAFAVTGWKIVRDICNIFFIIILVYTGFSAVFDTSKTSMRQVVPNLIINALLINFSLFATRLVIDISNVTARIFYSEMLVCQQSNIDANGNCPPAKAERGLGGYWPLSEKIVDSFNPQKLFSPTILQGPGSTTIEGTNINDSAANDRSSRDYANYFGVVCLVAAAIMIAVAVMFFKVSFLFLGRVVGLYVCMIFSPFAFLSRQIPLFGKVEKLRWTEWASELTSYAMLAPVFIFFLYIIYVLLTSSFVQQIGIGDTTGGFFSIVMSVAIPMFIIYSFMGIAQKMAENLSGDIGKRIQALGTTVTGLAVGAATGGAALVGSRVGGGLAKRVDESRVGVGIRNLAAKSGIAGGVGRSLQRGLNATRSGSFDVRQTSAGSALFKQLGINADQKPLNALAGVGLGLGTSERKGGFDADVKRRQEKQVANEKLFEEKDAAGIAAYNERKKKKYDKNVTDAVEAAMRANGHSQADIDAAKEAKKKGPTDPNYTNYDTWAATAVSQKTTQDNVNAIQEPKYVTSADDLVKTRRKTYTEGLKKGDFIRQWKDAAVKNAEEKGGLGRNILGAGAELLSATTGATIGSQVRTEGDRKAAKKIEEKSKAEKELENIETTLKKGFQDLIALERFKTSSSFTSLRPEEQAEILTMGAIQTGSQRGKHMYDILTADEQKAVDAEQKVINSDKDTKERWDKRVQAMEQSRYDMNTLKRDSKKFKKDMVNQTLTQNQRDQATKDYFETLAEIEQASKHNKIWNDISKYQEDQKKKIKGEEEKK